MSHFITSPDGTPVSRFAFGTMQFGGRADDAASAAMFDACRAAGINHFDTAHVYTDGASETILGKLAKGARDELIIASKAAYNHPATAAELTRSTEQSLQRLDMDFLDVLYLHRFDPSTDLRHTFEGLAQLKQRGLIRHIGLSNFAAWQVVKAIYTAQQFDLDIAILQPMYSLVKRQAEVEILPMAQDFGIAVAPYSPLGGGLLTGKYVGGQRGRLAEDSRYAARYGQGFMHQAAAELVKLALELGEVPATLAAAWVAAHHSAPMPILSARNAEQLQDSLAAIAYKMSPVTYARISALTPLPPPATDRIEEQ
ncbi:MAG: aldo/keto reductase [Sulfitobacter sp.]